MATAREGSQTATEASPITTDRPLRVLIVEDSPADAELSVAVLKRAGYPIAYYLVDSQMLFEQRLEYASYDLILCEHNLITWTGMEALETVKRRGKDIPFVLVSATLGDEAAVEYIKAGAADYVLKHRLDRLPAVVARALQEKAHREEAARLQDVIIAGKREWELTFDAVPDMVLLLDDQCRIQRANRAAAEFAKVPFSQLIGRHCYEALFDATQPPQGCPRKHMWGTGHVERGEFVDPRSGRLLEATFSPIRERNGSIRNCVCVMRDITEQRRAEEAQRASESGYRRLFEAAKDGILIIDVLSEEIIDVNPFLVDLLGCPRQEMLGRKLWEIGPFKDIAACKIAFTNLQEKEYARYEDLPLETSDGRFIDVEFVSNVYQVDDRKVIQCNVRDITERRRSQEALFQLASIVECSDEAIIGKTLDGFIASWNQAAERIYGYTAEEVMGRSVSILAPPDRPDELPQMLDRIKKGERIDQAETVRIRKNGQRIDVSLSISPIRDEAGRIIGASSIARDISDQKQAEKAVHAIVRSLVGATGQECLDRILESLCNWLEADCALIGEVVPGEAKVKAISMWLDGKKVSDYIYPLEGTACENVLRTGFCIHPENAGSLFPGDKNLKQLRIEGYAGTPLQNADGDLFGVLIALSRQPLKVTPTIEEVMDVMAAKAVAEIERIRSEVALAFNNAILLTQQETSLDGILVVDGQRTIISFNQRFIEMWGIPPDVVATRSDERVLQPMLDKMIDPKGFLEKVNYLYEHKEDESHEEIALRDGRIIDRFSSPMVGRDANYYGRVWYFRDITERKQMVDALRKGAERYRELFESANDAIYTTDLAGNFTSLNKMAEQLSGYTREEALQMNIDQMLVPEYVEQGHQEIQRVLAGGPPGSIEIEILAKDGHRVTLEVNGRILSHDGRPVGQLGIARDVTGRKQLEEQLRQALKMEAVGGLAGGVAHDFNNLLGVILGYGELLMEPLDPASPQYRKIDQIKKAAECGASLTRQLLAFSRKQVLQPRVLEINVVVGESEELVRRLIGEDIDLVAVLGSGLGRIKADQGQIEQVIMNLAINSRDAMPEGGKLTIETANAELDEGYARAHAEVRPGSYVMLAVSDTGIGMDKEVQAHIFEPFFTTKGPGKGTGLGLSTVYGIVRQSNGHIWAYSEPGKGTTFKIYLPRVEDTLDAVAGPMAVGPLQGSETVLLVEDETALRELTREFLEQNGYVVLQAKDPAEAIEVAERHQGTIHLLLTDVVMPGMNGRQLAQQLASLRPNMKVLYMSGYPDKAVVNLDVLESGLNFLGKPFGHETLLRKVRDVLEGKNGNQ